MDRLTPERRSENMRRIRDRDTAPEMTIRRLAHGMGFRFRLHVTALPGKPDLVFPRLGKIVEVRGCFFHQHPGCIDAHIPKSRVEYWAPKLDRNCRRDAENLKALRAAGWKVLIVWACEIDRKPASVEKRLLKFLENG